MHESINFTRLKKGGLYLVFLLSISLMIEGQTKTSKNCECLGQGSITIVMDAGMGNWSLFFKPLATELGNKYKICLISRKGYLDKNVPKTKRDLITIANEMNTELVQNGITEQFVLVGHSLGGLNARMYQKLFPKKVKAMILLDAAHPDLWKRIPTLKDNLKTQLTQVKKIITLAKFGLLHFAKGKIPTFGLPKIYLKSYYKVTTRSLYYKTYKLEMEALEGNLKQAEQLGVLGGLPLLIVASKNGLNTPINSEKEVGDAEKDQWLNMQRDLAKLSVNSTYIETGADHFLHITDHKKTAHEIESFLSKLE